MCRFEFKVRAEIGRCMGKQKALAEHIVAEANKIGKVKSAVDTAVKNLKGAMPWTDWAVMGFTGLPFLLKLIGCSGFCLLMVL